MWKVTLSLTCPPRVEVPSTIGNVKLLLLHIANMKRLDGRVVVNLKF